MKSLNIFILPFILQLALALPTSAQKLPNKQTGSFWAPLDVKIDGRSDEWNNAYRAYNKATELYYTISNDDRYLYLVAYVNSPDVLFYKVMTGGITFIIKSNNKEVSICYPAFDKPFPVFKRVYNGETFTGKEDDPVIVKNNKTLADKAKEIEVKGIKDIDSERISIYNEYGINVAAHFDAKLGYIYELGIPLKYLGSSVNSLSTLNYKILTQGKTAVPLPKVTAITHADGTTSSSQGELDALNQKFQALEAARYAQTDVIGEYILAKKP